MTDNIDEIYGSSSKFLKTNNVPKGQVLDMEIKAAEVKLVGDNKKIVLTLSTGQEFPLNKTNAKQLASNLAEEDFTKWVGKKFKLFRTTTQYQGGNVECLRVV